MERCRATRRLRAKIGRPSDRIPDRLSSAFRLGRNRPSDAARPFRTDRPVQTRGKRWFRISGRMIFFLLNNLQKTLGPIGRSPVITRPVRAGQMLAKDWRALTSVSVSIDQNLTLADSDSFFPPKEHTEEYRAITRAANQIYDFLFNVPKWLPQVHSDWFHGDQGDSWQSIGHSTVHHCSVSAGRVYESQWLHQNVAMKLFIDFFSCSNSLALSNDSIYSNEPN